MPYLLAIPLYDERTDLARDNVPLTVLDINSSPRLPAIYAGSFVWCPLGDLNPKPDGYEPSALPVELREQIPA